MMASTRPAVLILAALVLLDESAVCIRLGEEEVQTPCEDCSGGEGSTAANSKKSVFSDPQDEDCKKKSPLAKAMADPNDAPCSPFEKDCDIKMATQAAAAKSKAAGKTRPECEKDMRQAAQLAMLKRPDNVKGEAPEAAIAKAVEAAKEHQELESLKEDAAERKQEAKEKADCARASAGRGKKQLDLKSAQQKEAEIEEEAECVKEKAAQLQIQLQRAKADVTESCRQLTGAKATEKKAKTICEGSKKRKECKNSKKKAAEKKAADEAFARATKTAATRVLAAKKAAEMAAIAAGKSPAEAAAAGVKAQQAQAKALAAQAAVVKIDGPSRKPTPQIYDRIVGCSGWAPNDGVWKGMGQYCGTFGWSRKWCWTTKDYAGPGYEFIQMSKNYPGKLYAPCATKGTFVNAQAATWAATGCPNSPCEAYFAQYADMEALAVRQAFYDTCTSDLPNQIKICCGPDVDIKVGCNPQCKFQQYDVNTKGVKVDEDGKVVKITAEVAGSGGEECKGSLAEDLSSGKSEIKTDVSCFKDGDTVQLGDGKNAEIRTIADIGTGTKTAADAKNGSLLEVADSDMAERAKGAAVLTVSVPLEKSHKMGEPVTKVVKKSSSCSKSSSIMEVKSPENPPSLSETSPTQDVVAQIAKAEADKVQAEDEKNKAAAEAKRKADDDKKKADAAKEVADKAMAEANKALPKAALIDIMVETSAEEQATEDQIAAAKLNSWLN